MKISRSLLPHGTGSVLTSCAFKCLKKFLMIYLLIFFRFLFFNLVLKNETLKLKGRQYQHVLGLCAMVHVDNIKETVFRNLSVCL